MTAAQSVWNVFIVLFFMVKLTQHYYMGNKQMDHRFAITDDTNDLHKRCGDRRWQRVCAKLLILCALVTAGSFQFIAAEQNAEPETMMKPMTLQAEREIVALHDFFQQWYRGELEPMDFARFERALEADFQIITPAGRLLPRADIIQAVRQQAGSDPAAVLEIRNVELVAAYPEIAVFRYEEWQSSAGVDPRGRLSTVVFRRRDDAENGLGWRQVQETWLPE